MLIAEAEAEFRDFVNEHGVSPAVASPLTLFKLVLDFWEQTRALDAQPLDMDGDGLLFQWGQAYEGHFYLDLTRQFVVDRDEEQGEFFQLRCEFQYSPSVVSTGLTSGNEWCFDLNALPSFRPFVLTHPATHALEGLQPTRLVLYMDAI